MYHKENLIGFNILFLFLNIPKLALMHIAIMGG